MRNGFVAVLAGVGMGMIIAPAINTGTFGVAPQDAGVASATVTVGQMLGGSVGTPAGGIDVVAFEPDLTNALTLTENVARNGLANAITVVCAACGNSAPQAMTDTR